MASSPSTVKNGYFGCDEPESEAEPSEDLNNRSCRQPRRTAQRDLGNRRTELTSRCVFRPHVLASVRVTPNAEAIGLLGATAIYLSLVA